MAKVNVELKSSKDLSPKDRKYFDERLSAVNGGQNNNPVNEELFYDPGVNLIQEKPNGPWSRLNYLVERQVYEIELGEITDLSESGNRIGRVTIIGEEDNGQSNQVDIQRYDAYRQGKNIQNLNHFSRTLLPLVRMTSGNSMMSHENIFDHNLGGENYGLEKEYRTIDEDFSLIPFKDIATLNPVALIGNTLIEGYPIVTNLTENFDHFLDPSNSRYSGAIDIFYTRLGILNSVFDYFPVGLKSKIMGSDTEISKRGSVVIENKKNITENNNVSFYEDFTDVELEVIKLDYYVNQNMNELLPFKDENYFRFKNSNYYNVDENRVWVNNLLQESDKNKSEIGERFKSSTCGLLFGESNYLGTDSIAFGGFKK